MKAKLINSKSVFRTHTAQKMKFSIKDFFSKCDQICSKLRIWSHLLEKSLTKNFIFRAVTAEHLRGNVLQKRLEDYKSCLANLHIWVGMNLPKSVTNETMIKISEISASWQ